MRKVSRFYPPDREVLKDISLSFYPGAKIGVIGANGSGKSTFARLLNGLVLPSTGRVTVDEGIDREPEQAGGLVSHAGDEAPQAGGVLGAVDAARPLGDGPRLFLRAADDDHLVPRLGQGTRGCCADAVAGAGDHDGLVLERRAGLRIAPGRLRAAACSRVAGRDRPRAQHGAALPA